MFSPEAWHALYTYIDRSRGLRQTSRPLCPPVAPAAPAALTSSACQRTPHSSTPILSYQRGRGESGVTTSLDVEAVHDALHRVHLLLLELHLGRAQVRNNALGAGRALESDHLRREAQDERESELCRRHTLLVGDLAHLLAELEILPVSA